MTDTGLQQKRLVAAAIDVAIGLALGVAVGVGSIAIGMITGFADSDSILGFYGPRVITFGGALVGLVYVLGRDALAGGRSLGKKIQEIRVVTAAGSPIGPFDSVKRNAIFAVGSFLGLVSATLRLVPCLGDAVACLLAPLWLLGSVVTVVAVVVELVKITQDPDGVRFGDQIAETRVVR